MSIPGLPEKVYHGTDEQSAESIRRIGLDKQAWDQAAGGYGADPKGFSVTADRGMAELWAAERARNRGGPPGGVILEADAGSLPLRAGSPGEWTDPCEFFIAPEDFPLVKPGTFR